MALLAGDNPFHVTPLSGTLAPYSKATVAVDYTPSQPGQTKGFNTLLPTSDQVGYCWHATPCRSHHPPLQTVTPKALRCMRATSVCTRCLPLTYCQRTDPDSGPLGRCWPSLQAMRTYEYFAVVELLGQPCKLKLPIRGRGMPGGVRLSPASLFFGDVHTHAWADQLLTLSNTNTSMGARYQVRTQLGKPIGTFKILALHCFVSFKYLHSCLHLHTYSYAPLGKVPKCDPDPKRTPAWSRYIRHRASDTVHQLIVQVAPAVLTTLSVQRVWWRHSYV